nr:hypothetical protein [Tanacetum cinerariifolium]
MNYLEEQIDGEAMTNSIQNGDQPLPVIAQVSLAGTAQNVPPTLKDPKFWTAEEKKTRKIDLLKQSATRMETVWYTDKANQEPNDINIDSLYNILKQNEGDVNEALGYKKKDVVVTSDTLALVAEKMKVNKRKEKVVVSSDSKGSDSDESSSSAKETIAEVPYYTSESESESEYETSEYYDNSTNYGLFVNDNDDQEIFHDAIESASENFIENNIDSQKDCDKSEVDHNDSEEKEHLIDKLIRKFNHKIAKCQKRIEKTNQHRKDLENQNKDLKEKYDVL